MRSVLIFALFALAASVDTDDKPAPSAWELQQKRNENRKLRTRLDRTERLAERRNKVYHTINEMVLKPIGKMVKHQKSIRHPRLEELANTAEKRMVEIVKSEYDPKSRNESQYSIQHWAKTVKGNVRMLQIGATDGDFGLHVANKQAENLMLLPNVESTLVEPNPWVYKQLEANVKNYFGMTNKVRTASVAACAYTNKVPKQALFVVNDKFRKNYPNATHLLSHELSSLDSNLVAKGLESILSKDDVWNYIDEVNVPCLGPKDLLKAANLNAGKVDVLLMNTAGMDAKVLSGLLRLPEFRPQAILFETGHVPSSQVADITKDLFKKSYTVRYGYDNGSKVLAWKTHFENPRLRLAAIRFAGEMLKKDPSLLKTLQEYKAS